MVCHECSQHVDESVVVACPRCGRAQCWRHDFLCTVCDRPLCEDCGIDDEIGLVCRSCWEELRVKEQSYE